MLLLKKFRAAQGELAQRVRAKRGPMTGSGITRHCRKAKTADYAELKSAYELLFRVDVCGFSRHAPQDYPLLMNGLLRVPAIIGSAGRHYGNSCTRREAATASRLARWRFLWKFFPWYARETRYRGDFCLGQGCMHWFWEDPEKKERGYCSAAVSRTQHMMWQAEWDGHDDKQAPGTPSLRRGG
jgi:hypothetical protein